MAFPDGAAVLRADINGLIEEAYAADRFYIGKAVMPELSVDEKSGQYPVFKKALGELLNNDATARAPSGSYGRIIRAYENDNYLCVDRGLEELVDDTYARDVERFFNAEVTAGRQVLRQVMLGHEIRVAAAIFNTTNFGSATNSAVAYSSANLATIDFPQDVLAAIERLNNVGEQPNTIVMTGEIWRLTQLSTKFQSWIRGSRPSDATLNITPAAAAASFAENGITQVLVGRAAYNSAAKGQAFASAQVWSDDYIWVGRVETSPDMMAGGAGRTLVWNKEGGLFVTETYREEKQRSNVVRVRQNTAEKILDGTAGDLINTQAP